MQYGIKVMVTALLVVAVAEIAKRSTLLGAVIASVPLVSVLAMIWLYLDTGSVERVSALAGNVFWLVLPSLVLFLVLPMLLRHGVGFYPSLALATGLTVLSYWAMIGVLRYWGGAT